VAKAPDIAIEDIQVMMSTNVEGLINMTQAVLPVMKKRPDGGAGDIINIGSIAGREPYAGGAIYCATKAAVRIFTDALRRELIATRIRIMEVDPGQVETVGSLASYTQCHVSADGVNRSSPLFDSTVTRPRQTLSMRKPLTRFHPTQIHAANFHCDSGDASPLRPMISPKSWSSQPAGERTWFLQTR
jgi:short-subunit dehydrogenase